MATKTKLEAQNPLILRSQRLVEAFAKSDDERDFYLDRQEGFILYADLDKAPQDLETLEQELFNSPERYVSIPKLTFYETKKIMEGFVNEKVYDIDTKEKLLEIIQSKEARENFLDFIYDHHSELEKWQQFYQERSRIRIIEWLRNNHFHFVFEEDLDLAKTLIEKLKKDLFQTKVGKDIQVARKTLVAKAKTYYSNEALNPRPKRGRPPKQAAKLEIEPQISTDIYTTVPTQLRMFLFIPDYSSSSTVTFSSRFDTEEELLASRKAHLTSAADLSLESLNQKLAALRSLSNRWLEGGEPDKKGVTPPVRPAAEEEDEFEFSEEEGEEDFATRSKARLNGRKPEKMPPPPVKQAAVAAPKKGKEALKEAPPIKAKPPQKKPVVKKAPPVPVKASKGISAKSQTPVKKAALVKQPPKKAAVPKKPPMRSIMKLKPTAKKPVPAKKGAPVKKLAPARGKSKPVVNNKKKRR